MAKCKFISSYLDKVCQSPVLPTEEFYFSKVVTLEGNTAEKEESTEPIGNGATDAAWWQIREMIQKEWHLMFSSLSK